MSVFKVYFPDASTYDNEFEGTRKAGEHFHDYYIGGYAGGVEGKIFANFIAGLIENEHCVVTYKDDANLVQVSTPSPHVKQLFYMAGGVQRQIHVKGIKDNPANDIVSMAIPSLAADPDAQPTSTYLSQAICKLSDPGIGDSAKRAFLLGLLLLKRCR